MNSQKQKNPESFGKQIIKKKQTDHPLSSNSEDSDDEVDDIQVKKAIYVQRQSVSAEAYGAFNKKENFKPKIIPKNEDQKSRIKQRMQQAFMFNALDEKEKEIIIYAMEEKKFKKGDWVIKQGEEGDVIYVVDNGELDCFKQYTNEPQPRHIKTYIPGESFGELALLFQSPRAASIQVKSNEAVLWQLDRETFSLIVKEAAIRKREKYETFLTSWELLLDVDDPYEKLKMSDALVEKIYKEGQVIGQEGKKMNDFLIIDQGKVGAMKDGKQLFQYEIQGEFFGEISIVKGSPEPFSYVALSDCKLFAISKSSYTSTLVIVKDKLSERLMKRYGQYL